MARIDDRIGSDPSNTMNLAFNSLRGAGEAMGQTDEQIEEKLDALLSAYPGAWCLYFITGAKGAILAAITDDTSLPWLDADLGSETLRARILRAINRR
jgi:hypothetical protein